MGSLILTASLALLFFLCHSLNHRNVEGGRLLSKDEITDIEVEFRSLKKKAIKTIKDDAGDIFDCVDIMAQPAFDHPLLKNHKLKMRPTSHPRESRVKTSYRRPVSLPGAIGCPRGSVPIRRVEKEDLIRVKSLLPSYTTTFHPQTTKEPGYHLAVLRSLNLGFIYSGVEAHFNILNPRIGDAQVWSSAQLFVENGTESDFNSIQAGWTVSPALFNDNQTRSFLFWIGKGNPRGCYNLLCRGFIQVDKDHAVGRVLPTSLYGEETRDFPLSIHQDNVTKDWWLVNLDMNINYGYWPKELFPHLANGTTRITWGGVTRVADATQASPPMGSGYFPDGQFTHSGYFTGMKVVNGTTYDKEDPDHYLMETYSDVPTCYQVKDYQYQKENGYTFMYGGPGGNCGA